MNIRRVLTATLIASALLPWNLRAAAPSMTVYKTATCGCCGKWVEHARARGFRVIVRDVSSTADYQRKYGVPERLRSCHTAVVGSFTIEGHVPAPDVLSLLKNRPNAKGLAVPGMPMGSPGMEGYRRDAYSVLLFNADGSTSVYRSYSGD